MTTTSPRLANALLVLADLADTPHRAEAAQRIVDAIIELIDEAVEAHRENEPHIHRDGSTY